MVGTGESHWLSFNFKKYIKVIHYLTHTRACAHTLALICLLVKNNFFALCKFSLLDQEKVLRSPCWFVMIFLNTLFICLHELSHGTLTVIHSNSVF